MNADLRLRCAVLGRPIAHSLSPALHRAAYAALGLDWTYEAFDVGGQGLAGFLDGLDDSWRGLSLTMPLKRAVVPLLDEVSDRAGQARAANTLILERGRRVGHNTDITGLADALREAYDGPVDRATVLGGGATASSAVLALADLGCGHVTLLVRNEARAADTVAAASRHPRPPVLEVRALDSARADVGLLVSTIPAAAQTRGVTALCGAASVVFDVVYDPWPTPLSRAATSAGTTLVSGLDLLVHQAGHQVRLMTGLSDVPLAAMRAAGLAALDARGNPS